MKDLENNSIELVSNPNAHILVLGESGMGKTFYNVRTMEKYVKEGKEVLVLDSSGSYTHSELIKHNFTLMDQVQFVYGTKKDPFIWECNYTDKTMLGEDITDALLMCLGINSYFQKKWLKLAVEKYFEEEAVFSFPQLFKCIEKIYESASAENMTRDDYENVKRLLSRLSPYEKLKEFSLKIGKNEKKKPITIIDLNSYSSSSKRLLTTFLMELIWSELKFERNVRHCDCLVLDEFQFLALKEDSAFENLLRQGRRFGMEVLMSTQFISSYSDREIATLLQSGHLVLFQPTPKELKFTAGLIDVTDTYTWKKILNSLDRGKAILTGKYRLNASEVICNSPIICKI